MNGLELIFYAIFAAFMVYRLFSALGREDYEPDEDKLDALKSKKKQQEEKAKQQEKMIEASYQHVEDDTPYPPQCKTVVSAIKKLDPSFSLKGFVEGANYAFETIVHAFCEGDVETLEALLDKPLYHTFKKEVERRKKAGEVHECTIISGPETEIVDIQMRNKQVFMTVVFTSEQVEMVKDKKGKIISGDASDAEEVKDSWMFSRNMTSNDPNWLLVETHA